MVFDAQTIDFLAKRRDGGIDLFLMPMEPMDDSAQTQTELLDKVENYMKYAGSAAFQKEFPGVIREKVRIILVLKEDLSELMQAMCSKIEAWAAGERFRFLTVKK